MKKVVLFVLILLCFRSNAQQFENVGFEVLDNNCIQQSCSSTQSRMYCVEGWSDFDNTSSNMPLLRKENINCNNNLCESGNAILVFNGLEGPIFGPKSYVKTSNPMHGAKPIPQVVTMNMTVLPESNPGVGIHIDGLTQGTITESFGFGVPSQVGNCEEVSFILDLSVVEESQLVFRPAKEIGETKEAHVIFDDVSYCGPILNIEVGCGSMELSYNDCSDIAGISSIVFYVNSSSGELLFGSNISASNPTYTANIEPGEYFIEYLLNYSNGNINDDYYYTEYIVPTNSSTPKNLGCVTTSILGTTLFWDDVLDAEYYEILINQNNPICGCSIFPNPQNNTTIIHESSTNYLYLGMTGNLTCFSWSVRAFCKNGIQTGESQIMCFNDGVCSSKFRGREAIEQSHLEASIYPNPISGELNMELYTSEQIRLSIEIYNTDGKLVKLFAEETHQGGLFNKNWTIEDEITNGVYFVLFKTNIGIFQKKIVISKK